MTKNSPEEAIGTQKPVNLYASPEKSPAHRPLITLDYEKLCSTIRVAINILEKKGEENEQAHESRTKATHGKTILGEGVQLPFPYGCQIGREDGLPRIVPAG